MPTRRDRPSLAKTKELRGILSEIVTIAPGASPPLNGNEIILINRIYDKVSTKVRRFPIESEDGVGKHTGVGKNGSSSERHKPRK